MRSACLHPVFLLCALAFFPNPNVLVQVKPSGEVPRRRRACVFSPLEGRTTVLSAKPEGTFVKKGELVCELNPSPLKERLANQEIVIRGAEAAYEGARLAREVAEIALKEYLEGISPQEMATLRGEIALAESDPSSSEPRIGWR